MSHCLTRLLLPVLLATLGAVLPARAQTPPGALPFVTYGAEVGFGRWIVRDIAQDSRGVLWVGTDDGIYLYDGHRFRRAEHEGLPSTHISRLVAGANGDMWCGTLQGWARWRAGAWSVYGAAQGVPGTWNDLQVDGTGSVWVAAEEGLFRAGEDGRFARVPGWPGGVASSLWLEPGGDVYVLTAGALHHRDPEGRWRTWGEAQGLPREGLFHVARDGAGRVWTWGYHKLWRWMPGASAFEAVAGVEESRSLWRAVRDVHGSLWLASDKGVVVVGEDGRPRGVAGPQTQRVWRTFEDREGSIWVGGMGLFRLAGGGLWRTHSVREGLPSDELWAIHRDAGGRLWAGTSKGLARATAKGWEPVEAVPPRAVRGIFEEPGGALWLSGGLAELLRYEPRTGQLERFGAEQGLGASVTLTLVMDGEGALWVATITGALRGERHGAGWRFTPAVLPGGSPGDMVYDVKLDARGRVWLAGKAGLFVVEGHSSRRLTVADGLRRDPVSYLLVRRNGELCVSYLLVGGMSCFRYDGGAPGGFTHLDTTRGLASDRIYQLGEDAAGRLWVGTGKGVDVFGPEGRLHFSMADGLPGDDFNARAFWLDTHGDVWVGTGSGLGQFLARRYTGPPPPPGAVVASIRAGGKELGPGPHEVPHALNTLEVEVRAHTFLNEGQVRHEVRLVGLEPEWRPLEGHQARYTALAPGAYEFQARSRHADGAWGPIASISFVVLRPWWRTGWFYAGCLLGLGGLFALAVHLRGRTARHQHARLEALVALRTRELEEAQARLVLMEREATEQQMAGGFAHEMRNALTGAKMLLGTVLSVDTEPGHSLCVRNGALLKDLYVEARPHLPPEMRTRVATLLKELNGNEARMERVLRDTDEALGRALSVTRLLLEYARLGREHPGPEPARVVEVLSPLLEESRADFAAHSISLHLEGSGDCTVAVHPLHLYSLLKNLVLNARDALVEKSGPGARELRITLEEEPERVVLRVEDTGTGMPPEVRERIFEPFFSTKPDTGTGLGLSIVRKLARLYGGALSVESEPGRGTRFSLSLPRATPPPRERPS